MSTTDKLSSRNQPVSEERLALLYPDGSIGILVHGADGAEAASTKRFANAGKSVDQQARVVRVRFQILEGTIG